MLNNCTHDFCKTYPHLFSGTQGEPRFEDTDLEKWAFMGSPIPVLSLLAAYLYFVLRLGPSYMETKRPLSIRYLMMAYNLFQVIYNARLCLNIFLIEGVFWYLLNHSCHPLPANLNPLMSSILLNTWYYFISKVTDLLDTVFFVIRKKQSHVTFLHVYHHSIMLISTWAFLKYVQGTQVAPVGLLNSFVHTVMYSYYFLSALGPRVQRYLWWKSYITRLQLTQFVLIVVFLVSLLIRDCELPRFFVTYMVLNTLGFLYLFTKFYISSYVKTKAV